MSEPPRILVVSYYYPPDPTVGGHRWATQTKYLRRLGYEVSVITSATYGALPDDAELNVHRTGDLAASPALRRLLRRPALSGSNAPGQETMGVAPPRYLTSTLVPDPYVLSWAPFALKELRRLVRLGRVDCVVTSSPPESTHLIGRALLGSGIGWVADFRDGWRYEPTRAPFPTRLQREFDARLERWVVRHADAVVGATTPIATDLSSRMGIPATAVLNAWDPDLETDVAAIPRRLSTDSELRLVHTGRLSGEWGRDPRPILEALTRVADAAPRLRLVLAGGLTPAERRMVADLAPPDRVILTGQLPRVESLALQREADALLLLTSRRVSEATGKLFEYLAAGRPILALAEDNEAARIVRETRSGIVVPLDDVEAIAAALSRLHAGDIHQVFAPTGLADYRYPRPSEMMAETIESAVTKARTRQDSARW